MAWAYGALLLPYAVYVVVLCVGMRFWWWAGMDWWTGLFFANLASVPVVTGWWVVGAGAAAAADGGAAG